MADQGESILVVDEGFGHERRLDGERLAIRLNRLGELAQAAVAGRNVDETAAVGRPQRDGTLKRVDSRLVLAQPGHECPTEPEPHGRIVLILGEVGTVALDRRLPIAAGVVGGRLNPQTFPRRQPIEEAERLGQMLLSPEPVGAIALQIVPVAKRRVRHGELRIEHDSLAQQFVSRGHIGASGKPQAIGVELERIERRGGRLRQRHTLLRDAGQRLSKPASHRRRQAIQRPEDLLLALRLDRLGQHGGSRLRIDDARGEGVDSADLGDAARQDGPHAFADGHF